MYGLDKFFFIFFAKSHFFSLKTKNKFAKLNIYKMSCQVVSINISLEYKGNFALSQHKVKRKIYKCPSRFLPKSLGLKIQDPQTFISRAHSKYGHESAQYPNVNFCQLRLLYNKIKFCQAWCLNVPVNSLLALPILIDPIESSGLQAGVVVQGRSSNHNKQSGPGFKPGI